MRYTPRAPLLHCFHSACDWVFREQSLDHRGIQIRANCHDYLVVIGVRPAVTAFKRGVFAKLQWPREACTPLTLVYSHLIGQRSATIGSAFYRPNFRIADHTGVGRHKGIYGS